MTGLLEQVSLGQVRGGHEGVAVSDVAAAGVFFHLHAHGSAIGVEDGETGTNLIREGEQVQLSTQAAVVTLFSFFHHGLVGLQGLLGFEGGAINALQTSLGLVTAPVGSRGTRQGKCRDVLGGRHVRAAAEIEPLHLAGARVDVVIVGQIAGTNLGSLIGIRVHVALVLDQLQLEGLVGQCRLSLLGGGVDVALEALAALDDLLHALLNGLEVLWGKGLSGLEVEVEAILDGRANAQLGARELRLYRLGHNVPAGVADNGAAIFLAGSNRGELGVRVRGVGKVVKGAVSAADDDDSFRALVGQLMLAHRCSHGSTGRDRDWFVVHRDCWNHFRHDLVRSFALTRRSTYLAEQHSTRKLQRLSLPLLTAYERFAPEGFAFSSGWHEVHGRTNVGDPLVEPISFVKARLNRLELGRRVLLVANKDQPGVAELTALGGLRSRRQVVVIRATQQFLLWMLRRRMRSGDMRVLINGFEPKLVAGVQIHRVELVLSTYRSSGIESAPSRVLTCCAIKLLPCVQVHVDAAYHHGAAAGEGAVFDPHLLVEVFLASGINRSVLLPEEVAGSNTLRCRSIGMAESLLDPRNVGVIFARTGHMPQHEGGSERIIAADLQDDIRLAPFRAEVIMVKSLDIAQPAGLGDVHRVEESLSPTARDGEVCWGGRQFGFEAAQRVLTGAEATGILRPQAHQRGRAASGGVLLEVKAHQLHVRLDRSLDACLVLAVEGDDIATHGLLAIFRACAAGVPSLRCARGIRGGIRRRLSRFIPFRTACKRYRACRHSASGEQSTPTDRFREPAHL